MKLATISYNVSGNIPDISIEELDQIFRDIFQSKTEYPDVIVVNLQEMIPLYPWNFFILDSEEHVKIFQTFSSSEWPILSPIYDLFSKIFNTLYRNPLGFLFGNRASCLKPGLMDFLWYILDPWEYNKTRKSKFMEKWIELIEFYFESFAEYELVSSSHLGCMASFVFARSKNDEFVLEIRDRFISFGWANYCFNKGCLYLDFMVGNRIVFSVTNCHLQPHADSHSIRSRQLQLESICEAGAEIDPVVLTGDMNFRVSNEKRDDILLGLSAGDWKTLSDSCDEFNQYKSYLPSNSLLNQLNEFDINFPPSYKLVKKKQSFDIRSIYSPKRTPAWCDRILFMSQNTSAISVHKYGSCVLGAPIQPFSDHFPVFLLFNIERNTKELPLWPNSLPKGQKFKNIIATITSFVLSPTFLIILFALLLK